jgi:hypothetical protein
MNFDLVRPCGECPFRNDRPPFGLKRERVREILGGARRGRQWWPASSFPCHKTIDVGERIIPPTAQQCAGVMIILHREGRWNDAMQLAQRFGHWHPERLDLSAPVYPSTQAAVEANNG